MTLYHFAGEQWQLPEPTLKQDSDMRTGEFVDSKLIIQGLAAQEANRYQYILPLACIFLRKPGELYHESMLYESGERMAVMRSLPLDYGLEVYAWYDTLSNFIQDHSPLFRPGKGQSGAAMKRHFQFWGWTNMIINMAKDQLFTIPGSNMNAIQAVRNARLIEVLEVASEQKEYNEASYLDQKAEIENNK